MGSALGRSFGLMCVAGLGKQWPSHRRVENPCRSVGRLQFAVIWRRAVPSGNVARGFARLMWMFNVCRGCRFAKAASHSCGGSAGVLLPVLVGGDLHHHPTGWAVNVCSLWLIVKADARACREIHRARRSPSLPHDAHGATMKKR